MAKSRVVTTVLALNDKMSDGVKRTAKETKTLERQVIKAQNSVKKFGKASVARMDKMAKSALKMGSVAAGALVLVGKASIENAQVQLEAEKKLTVIAKQRMNATDAQIQSILNLTAAQQELGVVGDEVQISGAQQLATFLDSTDSVETLIPAMNNLLVQQNGLNSTTENAVSIGNLMGKVMQGQTSALKKVGITFTAAQETVLKYGNEQERAAMLAQVITDNVGEMNKAFAKTDAGKIQQAKNTLGDLSEKIGIILLPQISKIFKYISKNSDKIQKTIDKYVPKIINVTKKIAKLTITVAKFIKKNGKTILTQPRRHCRCILSKLELYTSCRKLTGLVQMF